MNGTAFILIAVFTLTSALAAATLPKLMHAALCVAVMFVGVAGFFFLLGAEFVGLVQVFVYVGAVAVLIVFTILLTRRESDTPHGFHWRGIVVAVLVFAALVWAIMQQDIAGSVPAVTHPLTVKQIGQVLMTDYVWPLQCVGV